MVKSTGIYRQADQLGRVVLPLDVREHFGIGERSALEVLVDEERGQIILQTVSKRCLRCGSGEELREIKVGHYLCAKCIAELK